LGAGRGCSILPATGARPDAALAKEGFVAKLRHLAIASQDPDTSARFFTEAFGFQKLRTTDRPTHYGHILTDGTINLAILKFRTDGAAGVELGTGFTGLHHIGFEVEDADTAAEKVLAAGGRSRKDIDAALGVRTNGDRKGELKYSGPDGVLFDLGEPGFWRYGPEDGAGT
jgi:catechol 2,3-dioxygenase-like lactoylglutathione lyase family enzyme